jgi:hypothetical protein
MSNIVGRLEDVGIGLESSRGVAVAPTYWLAAQNKDYDDKVNVMLDDSSLGVLAENSNAVIQKQWADGSINGNVYQNSIGILLSMLAGAAPSTVTSTGEYTNTWVQTNTVTNKSATIAFKDSNVNLAFANAMLDSLKLNLEVDKFFNFESQFLSKKSATAANTVAHSAENIFAPKHAVIKLASTQSGLAAASAISLRSASITFAKNVEDKQILGSVDLSDVLNKTVTITGTLEVYYTDTTYKDYVFNSTEKALRIGVVNTDATLANSSNPHLYIDLYRVRFHDWAKNKGNNDIVTETVSFTALVDFSNSLKAYTIELLNGVNGASSY